MISKEKSKAKFEGRKLPGEKLKDIDYEIQWVKNSRNWNVICDNDEEMADEVKYLKRRQRKDVTF